MIMRVTCLGYWTLISLIITHTVLTELSALVSIKANVNAFILFSHSLHSNVLCHMDL